MCQNNVLVKKSGDAVYTDSFVLFSKKISGADKLVHDVVIRLDDIEKASGSVSQFKDIEILNHVIDPVTKKEKLTFKFWNKKRLVVLEVDCLERLEAQYPVIEVITKGLELKTKKVSLCIATLEKYLEGLKQEGKTSIDLYETDIPYALADKETGYIIMQSFK